jgi:hypothetical protein
METLENLKPRFEAKMTKDERIIEVQTKIDMLKSILEPHLKELTELERKLSREMNSFDIGMKVVYTSDDCGRGCHTTDYQCIVESTNQNGTYNLREITGRKLSFTYVSNLDMKEVR